MTNSGICGLVSMRNRAPSVNAVLGDLAAARVRAREIDERLGRGKTFMLRELVLRLRPPSLERPLVVDTVSSTGVAAS